MAGSLIAWATTSDAVVIQLNSWLSSSFLPPRVTSHCVGSNTNCPNHRRQDTKHHNTQGDQVETIGLAAVRLDRHAKLPPGNPAVAFCARLPAGDEAATLPMPAALGVHARISTRGPRMVARPSVMPTTSRAVAWRGVMAGLASLAAAAGPHHCLAKALYR